MFLDNSLAFQGTSGVGQWTTAQTGATTNTVSTNIIDVEGFSWVTYATQAGPASDASAMRTGYNTFGGGNDWGSGTDGIMKPYIYFTVVGTPTAAAGTWQPYIQAAPVSRAGTQPAETFAPGTFLTIWNGPTFNGTQLSVAGRYYLAPLPPTFALATTNTTAPTLMTTEAPRFYKMGWTVQTTLTSLTILAGLVFNPSEALIAPTQYNLNYVVV